MGEVEGSGEVVVGVLVGGEVVDMGMDDPAGAEGVVSEGYFADGEVSDAVGGCGWRGGKDDIEVEEGGEGEEGAEDGFFLMEEKEGEEEPEVGG